MVAHYTLTVYRADDVTPWFEVSTDPAHPHPYLHPPGEYDQGEIDLLGGRALVGELQLRVIDPQTGADQSERWLTGLLGIPAGEEGAGHSALNGRRGLLTQSDGAVVLDGVVSGVRLSETYAGFHLGLRDIRERHRRVSLFGRTGTATVLPRGVLNGYGKLPGGGWLIPPTEPLPAVYRGSSTILGQSGYFDLSGLWTGRPLDGSRTATAPAVLVLTDSMRRAATITMVGDVVPLPVYRNIEVWWRRTSGDTSWHIITDIRPRGASPHPLLLNHTRARVEGVDGEVEAIYSIGVAGGGFAGPPLDVPDDGESVEVLVLYVGPPTEDYPYHWEGPAGELLAALYDGTYSEAPITDRVDPAAIAALTTPVRLRLTEAPQADRSREWIENVYRQLRAAPALDRSGRISPVTAALPDPSEVLVELTDDVCQPIPGWDHPATDAVTAVRITYPRDYRVPVEDDPLGERSAGDGLASIDVTVERRAPEWVIDLMGEQVHEIDGFLYRALGIVGSAGTIDPASGDITDETGHLEATRAAREILDRWVFGGQVSFARVMRSALPDLRPGQWVIDRRSWRPNYRELKRGGASLAQIMSVRALDPAWLEVSLVDAGPADQPLTAPAIGTPTAADDGVVTVPVTTVPTGGEAAIYYAVAASAPAWGSGAWRLAGRIGQAGDVFTPPQPAGAQVWITARGEGLGRRPSDPTTPVSVTVTATPRVRDVRLVIADDGTPTVSWTPNVAAAGVRVYYATHALEDPEPDPVTYLDADASAGELVLPTVPLGRVLTIEVEPWTGYSGGAVSGTPGARVRLSRLYASSAALLVEYSGPAPGENVSPDFDPLVHAYMRQSVDGGVSWTQWARIVGEKGDPGSSDMLVLDTRWRPGAGALSLDLLVDYGADWRSLRIQYTYPSTPGGLPDTAVNYTVNLGAGGGHLTHQVEDENGLVRFWPAQDPAPTLTITPYTGTNGSGSAGTARTVTPEAPGETGMVGGRVALSTDPTSAVQGDRVIFAAPSGGLGFNVTQDAFGRPLVQIAGNVGPSIPEPTDGALIVGGPDLSYYTLAPQSPGQVLLLDADRRPTWAPVPLAPHGLTGHLDVTIASPTSGQYLGYDGTQWVNRTFSGGGVGVGTGRTISAGTGLTGGGDLSANRSISLDTGYTDGRYVRRSAPGVQVITGPIELRGPENEDTDLLRIGDRASGYGFWWRYAGSGTGASNFLELWTDNQNSGSPIRALSVDQSGVITIGGSVSDFYFTGNGASLGTLLNQKIGVGDPITSLSAGALNGLLYGAGGTISAVTHSTGVLRGMPGGAITFTDNVSDLQVVTRSNSQPQPLEGRLWVQTGVSGTPLFVGTGSNWVPITAVPVLEPLLVSGDGIEISPAGYDGTQVTTITLDIGTGSGQVARGNHNHDTRYYTQGAADSRFLRKDTSDTMAGNFTVQGTVSATGGFFDTSDESLKRDIRPLGTVYDPRALLGALEPVAFRWRATGLEDVGHIAQRVPMPFRGPGSKTIAYHRITTTLVAGWQLHEAEIDALKREVAALRKEVRRGVE